ncbi:MAG TPA: alpha-glucan family phosphorylase [Acidimicrobiia bacterium]|nr:alpha-glucan family phosphorylase [Acidimicrobiia bacterium]
MVTPDRSALDTIPVAAGTQVHIPRTFERLYDLAYNTWWTWQPYARELWQRVSPPDWAHSPNPLTILQTMAPEQWETLESNDSFIQLYEDVISAFDQYLQADDTWYHRNHADALPGGLVYLCTEFGVHHTLPFYSGGLGVLAGDHTKAASDLGVPMVGVGLLYRRGFFRQAIDPDGFQQHHYLQVEIARRPLRRALNRMGHPLTVQVDLPGRQVDVGVWRLDVGRVPLLLLDTDLPSNDPADRPITNILYVRGREMRLCQELVLGIGAVKAVEALGMEPSTWHINEGHAAFSLLQRLSNRLAEGDSWDAAVKAIRERSVFTLHTPVPAGNEVFALDLVERYLGGRLPGIDDDTLRSMGDSGRDNIFDLGALAIRLSSSTNGVSKRHGEVVTNDWQHIIGGPGSSVTNGVHMPTWIGGQMSRHIAEAVGSDWSEHIDPGTWDKVLDIPNTDVWEAHCSQKERLLRHLRRRVREQLARHGASPGDLRRVRSMLPAERLTIVFARRFATYKRAGLILSDLGRLQWILTNPERPVQIIFSGKAHPADREGQALIRRVVEMSQTPELNGHIVFVEDYTMEVARYLVGGADVWLNNPRPPMEASGTSGMKSAANGGLNLSVLDGWWGEGYTGDNGWGFGEHSQGDEADARRMYDILEHEVVAMYYDRDEADVPQAWVDRMKQAIASVGPAFSAQRMVAEYLEGFYVKANGNGD